MRVRDVIVKANEEEIDVDFYVGGCIAQATYVGNPDMIQFTDYTEDTFGDVLDCEAVDSGSGNYRVIGCTLDRVDKFTMCLAGYCSEEEYLLLTGTE